MPNRSTTAPNKSGVVKITSMAWGWTPVSRAELNDLIAADLRDASDEERAYFNSVAVEPSKWRQSPYGDEGGGFWAVAVDGDRVLWYNDIEEGFNVSRFTVLGTIPDDEYWCNQDQLPWALPNLRGLSRSGNLGPPEPLPDE